MSAIVYTPQDLEVINEKALDAVQYASIIAQLGSLSIYPIDTRNEVREYIVTDGSFEEFHKRAGVGRDTNVLPTINARQVSDFYRPEVFCMEMAQPALPGSRPTNEVVSKLLAQSMSKIQKYSDIALWSGFENCRGINRTASTDNYKLLATEDLPVAHGDAGEAKLKDIVSDQLLAIEDVAGSYQGTTVLISGAKLRSYLRFQRPSIETSFLQALQAEFAGVNFVVVPNYIPIGSGDLFGMNDAKAGRMIFLSPNGYEVQMCQMPELWKIEEHGMRIHHYLLAGNANFKVKADALAVNVPLAVV